jgi:hypothetical protein
MGKTKQKSKIDGHAAMRNNAAKKFLLQVVKEEDDGYMQSSEEEMALPAQLAAEKQKRLEEKYKSFVEIKYFKSQKSTGKNMHFVYGLLQRNVTIVTHFGVGSGNVKRLLGHMYASGSTGFIIFADHLPKNVARNCKLYLQRHYKRIQHEI